MNLLIFAKNFENYKSGYYHDDIIRSLRSNYNCYIYGPGYENFNKDFNIQQVIDLANYRLGKIDLLIIATSWDDDPHPSNVDPCPNIRFFETEINSIYFLNKEYKKFDERIQFIRNNKFSITLTVHPHARKWANKYQLNIRQFYFGIDLDRFKLKIPWKNRKYDIAFTGGLHTNHLDDRYIAKSKIFTEYSLKAKTNQLGFHKKLIQNDLTSKYKIYWAEWGSKNIFGKSLLPTGNSYVEFLNSVKIVISTLSAQNILGTRFFELMASGAIILTPKTELYPEILIDNETVFMYTSENFNSIVEYILNPINEAHIQKVINRNQEIVLLHSYKKKFELLLPELIDELSQNNKK